MKIVKHPDMQAVCHRCKCEFEFDVEDVREHGGSGRKRQPRQYLGVPCPVCKKITEVWGGHSYRSLSISSCEPAKQEIICQGSLSECPIYLQNRRLWFDRGVVYKRIEGIKHNLAQNIPRHPGFEVAIEMVNELLGEIRQGYTKETERGDDTE